METFIVQKDEKYDWMLKPGEVRNIAVLAVRTARADIRATLAERARLRLVFLFAGNGGDIFTSTISVEHEGADSVSDVVVRGIAQEKSSAAVEGRIVVRPEAVRSSSRFEGKALLFNSGRADITPVLEILTSDVVMARHAASVARITPEESAYLESRGLSPEVAARELAHGFLAAPFSCAIEIPREFEMIEKKLAEHHE